MAKIKVMSLQLRRVLAATGIALILIIAFIWHPTISLPSSQINAGNLTDRRPPRDIVLYARNLASQQKKIPDSIKIGSTTVPLERRGNYSILCLGDSCALLKDRSARFKIFVGPKAKSAARQRSR